jgi:hypothetical protein
MRIWFLAFGTVVQFVAAYRNIYLNLVSTKLIAPRVDSHCRSARFYGLSPIFVESKTKKITQAPALGQLGQARNVLVALNTAGSAPSFELSVSDGEGHVEDPTPIRAPRLIPAERYTTADWWRCLASLPKSTMLQRVSSHLLANTIFAVMVWAAYVFYPQHMRYLTAGLNPQHHLLLGNALGLLLVFRTNTAYDRFWEGRRLWGFMIGRIREVLLPRNPSVADGER